MVRLGQLLILTFLALWMTACGRTPKAEKSCDFVQNRYKERVSWNKNVPITLYAHESVPAEALDEIQSAVKTWNQSLGREVLRYGGQVNGARKPLQDQSNQIYWMTDWDKEKIETEQARTTIYWTSNTIQEADLQINANLKLSYKNDGIVGIDLESLLVHEFGHILGLAHNENPPTVMAETLMSGFSRRKLEAVDVENVKCEY